MAKMLGGRDRNGKPALAPHRLTKQVLEVSELRDKNQVAPRRPPFLLCFRFSPSSSFLFSLFSSSSSSSSS